MMPEKPLKGFWPARMGTKGCGLWRGKWLDVVGLVAELERLRAENASLRYRLRSRELFER